ncbi:MAG: hypothetical protein ABW148_06090 [Sedimenticola sp.]
MENAAQFGQIGFYMHENGKAYAILRKGDEGIFIEELLPLNMRGEYFGKAPIKAYFTASCLWFSTPEQWEAFGKKVKASGAEADNPINLPTPPYDFEQLGLLDHQDNVDYQKLKALFSLIFQHWKKSPVRGLIALMSSQGHSADDIAPVVDHIIRREAILDLPAFLRTVLLPPECRQPQDSAVVSKEQLDFAFAWLYPSDDTDQHHLKQHLRQLGLLNQNDQSQLEPMLKASAYIWSHREDVPDFEVLMKITNPDGDSASLAPAKKAKPKKALQKRKKRNRKHGRLKKRKR